MTGSTATSSNLTQDQWASKWMEKMDTPVNFSDVTSLAREAADLDCNEDTFRMTTCKGTFEYLQRVSY